MKSTEGNEKEYTGRKIRLSIWRTVLTFAFLIVILVIGASTFVRTLVADWSGNFYFQAALYLIIFRIIYDAVFLPMDYYGSFTLEHEFSLSNQTFFDWIKQGLKKWMLSLLLFMFAAEALYAILKFFPNYWWLVAMAGWFVLTIVIGKLAPVLIIPLYYKCTKLENDELKEKLLKISSACNVKIKEVFEIQLSKETKKANAAVVGFGKSKRILIADSLLQNYTNDEIEAIFAHELGHICLHHITKIFIFGAAVSFVVFYFAYISFDKSMVLFGFEQVYDVAAFPLLVLIFSIAGLIFLPLQNAFTRHLEKQADLFAVSHIQGSENFASALSKLGKQNLSDPSPSKIVRFFFYTHPPISERISYTHKK